MSESRFDVIPYTDLSPEPSWTRLGKVQKYFARECKIMQEARHPNIVQYIGLCLAPPAPPSYNTFDSMDSYDDSSLANSRSNGRQRILIISEFLPGGNLRSYIAGKEETHPFPWRLRLSYSIDIARALAYMHARKCMHRDLKGENMLITENQRIKVCDFGFARIAARNAEELKRMSYCGSTPTMAPEILTGIDFGLEIDVFSLGIVFIEIMCRLIADDDIFARGPPTYALDVEEVKQSKSAGCPDAYFQLAIDCCATEAKDRPSMFNVLQRLRAIERQIIADERKDGTIKSYPVGSLSFASPRKTITGRPAMPNRIPSFNGKVAVPQRNGIEEDSEDDDVEDASAKITAAELGIHSAGRASGSRLLNATDSAHYSTGVVRRSKIVQSEEDTDTSSTITVRAAAPPTRIAPQPPQVSVIKVPSSWLKKPAADIIDSSSSSDASAPATPADENAAAPSKITIGSYMTCRTDTPSIAAATADDTAEEEHDSVPPSPRTALLISLDAGGEHNAEGLHRFTLVQPAWARLFGAPLLAMTPSASRSTSIDLKKVDFSKAAEVAELSPALIKTHCAVCMRKLGLLKAFVQCDDCGAFRAHPRCSDAAPATCAGHGTTGISSQSTPNLLSVDGKAALPRSASARPGLATRRTSPR